MYPLEPGDVEAAMSAAVSAASELQSHTQSLIAGLGSPGGDPFTGESTQQPDWPDGHLSRDPEGSD